MSHKIDLRIKRKMRIRAKISGDAKRPRASLFRSNRYLFMQLIDDEKRVTLLGLSEKGLKLNGKTKLEKAKEMGTLVAQKAKAQKIETVVFDRGGYRYHGRVKAFVEGMREGGLTV